MATNQNFEIGLNQLALEPMDDKITAATAPAAPGKFHANTRSTTHRRMLADRRVEIRFQADRRSGKDRRPKVSWEPGSNL